MKTKITILLIIALSMIALFGVFKPEWRNHDSSITPIQSIDLEQTSKIKPSDGHADTNLTSEQIKMRNENQDPPPVNNRLKEIMLNGHGDGAVPAMQAMEAHLKKWDPVGHTLAELEAIFGNRHLEKDGVITYPFNTGNDYYFIKFLTENGRIVAVKRLKDMK